MVDSPQVSLKVIFGVHLTLTVWAAMAGFLGGAYMYMNAFVLLFGFWAILHPESTDALLMFIVLNLVNIVQDIVFLAVQYPIAHPAVINFQSLNSLYQFSLGMAIVNLLIRPFTSFVLYRIYQSRGGRYGDLGIPGIPGIPQFTGPSSTPGYENIDSSVPANVSSVETAEPHNTYKPPQ